MILYRINLFIFLFISISGISQNMKDGFAYLDTGKYKQAETFFENILKRYPTNKTARLCYGRAIGLNGNPKKAQVIFTDLLRDYRDDFEVKLNYGEALLWNEKFFKAKFYYKDLVDENNQSFSALLGLANTLSNLKEYKEALVYVNKALAVSPGNPNALISKKYISLGYAYQQQQFQQYELAETLLKESLLLAPNDKDILLNLADLYLIMDEPRKAEATYSILIESTQDIENKLSALNGLVLAAHLQGKEKKALKISQLVFNTFLGDNIDKTLVRKATERYVQALIWNKKYQKAEAVITDLQRKRSYKNIRTLLRNKEYKKAETLTSELIKEQSYANWLLSLRATLNIYKGNFKKSLSDYNLVLAKDSASFNGNLGKANALKAAGFYDEAYKSAENTLLFYEKQKDATDFIKALNRRFTPYFDIKASFSFDNGDNDAYSWNVSTAVPLSTKVSVLGSYKYRTTTNSISNTKAITNNFHLGASYQILNNLTLKGHLGLISSEVITKKYDQFLTNISFSLKPFKLQDLEVGYKREIQDFNTALLDREIMQNNFYVDYNLSTNFNLGWFTQYYYTFQNDDNVRNLFFTSLYYKVIDNPFLKTGINYQYIAFKNQVPTIYFSPRRFNAVEVFFNIIKEESLLKKNGWFYELTAATGFQFIENNKRQGTYRFKGKVGYKLSEISLLNIYGTRSNIASTTAAGFIFTEMGIRFKWYLFDKPLFRKRLF
ncbi:Tetratricopeptide TPR_2 repeat-containing protein [Tenacibaculum maritimum]|nr:Tetratricopeptide TPR_2 repeat-containing protein [Tenacibaculum maritimum]